MYGSTKPELENNVYKVIDIYNSEKSIDDFSTLKLIKLLSVRRIDKITSPRDKDLVERYFNSDKEIIKSNNHDKKKLKNIKK